ncbi:MAG: CTP synthase [Candidatus Marisimplicoccus sp.]|jgi:CTP synthase
MNKPKYIFVTGGVTSSLGKGIVSASLARLLQAQGLNVAIQKLDPYINVDPGTLNPYEHGECYVTDDGAETDLDLGHYERFLSRNTSQRNNITTGKIYQNVIEKERKGEFLGKTVQVIPHITNEIKENIRNLDYKNNLDIIITEIGGTVGDIESLPFIEAVRQVIYEEGPENSMVIHLTLIPYLSATGELKTKPTQHSVKTLMELGLKADVLVCRSERDLSDEVKNKLALFCNVKLDCVIQSIDVETIYDVPIKMRDEGLDKVTLQKLKIKESEPDLDKWKNFLHKLKNPTHQINIGLVGKYVELNDSYKSILESLIHAGTENEVKVNVKSIHSEYLDKENINKKLIDLDGIIVAPGFGQRGLDGKILAVEYARVNKIPFLGICLGMQMAVIEYARNVKKIRYANSTEISEKCKDPVIDLMTSQKKIINKGGTMRLGAWDCEILKNTISNKIYSKKVVSERHRHRFEFNDEYSKKIFDENFIVAGKNPETNLVEIVENKDHPWFVGVQFHPEYKSSVYNPHPIFVNFVKASLKNYLKK